MRFKEFNAVLKEQFEVPAVTGPRGPAVADMQKVLVALGHELPKHGVDGIIGPETEGAIRAFQQANQLSTSGKPDPATIEKLNGTIATQPQLAAKLVKSTPADVKSNQGSQHANDGKTLSSGGASGAALKEPEFMPKLEKVAQSLGIDKSVLLSVMKFESNLNPQAVNPMSRATGLIQFMPKTARGLGTTIDELFAMTATNQLDYVEKYYKSNGVKPGATVGDLYMLTFMPAAANKPDDFVLGDANGGDVFGLSKSAVYNQNRIFDADKDGVFTVADVKNRINRTA